MTNDDSNDFTLDLKSFLESTPDLYLILDVDLTIIEVSKSYLRATMVNREDIMGKNVFDIFPDNPNDHLASGEKNLRASLARVLKNKAPDSMAVQKYDIRRPIVEGSVFEERYWSPINSPILDTNNEVKYIIHRVEDVTGFIKLKEFGSKKQKFNEELLEKTEQMELEIYRRAQEIQETNKQLNIAKEVAEKLAKMADTDNKAKSTFLATMSHELRTSLNGVIGMTELLLETPLAAQQLEFAETIRISGEALLRVINDVLDYSKIEAGHLQLGNVDFEVQLMVDQAIEVVIGQVYRKRIEIGAYIEPDVPKWCFGDPGRIRQVLNNLICNAVKFTQQGEISIWIKLVEKKDGIVILQFEIVDTGIGIEPEAIEHIFQPFSQGDSATFLTYGGTGLGLCISKQLVELMGGTIKVESIPRKGSKFWFTLHLKESQHPVTQEFKIMPEFVNSRILCIDESYINRELIQRLLTLWGMRCDTTNDAAKGLAMLAAAADQKDPYQLVFVDDCMSNMNGPELIKMIRQLKKVAKMPVIMLLSFGFIFDEERLEDLSVSMSISKPIQPVKLYAALVNILHKKIPKVKSIKTANYLKNKYPHLNAHVLLAEDNFINQQICLRILQKLGLTSDVVTSGFDAVKAFKTMHYNLILMDCQMPGMDGYTATEEIRKQEHGSSHHIPVIAMTANALKGDREKCLQAGMDDYISKPINFKLLTELLEKWLFKNKKTLS